MCQINHMLKCCVDFFRCPINHIILKIFIIRIRTIPDRSIADMKCSHCLKVNPRARINHLRKLLLIYLF